MLSTATPTLVAVIMEGLQQLDPRLLDFWAGFPCPPPWKEELLFRLNWTGCVGLEVGERMRSFMADKCNIRHDGHRILPHPIDHEGNGDGDVVGGAGDRDKDDDSGGVLVEEDCGLPCQIVISVICVLFLALLFVIILCCVRRHRNKPSSPTHQSALTEHQDGTKYYTSCHYACAPVMARQLQASLNGERTETTLLPGNVTGANGHYTPGSYPQHSSCVQAHYEHHSHLISPRHHHYHHRHHNHHGQSPQSPPHLINTPYGQVPAHTSSLVVPNHGAYGHRGKLIDAYTNSGSVSNSDPVYESINGDSDSARHTSLSEEGCCEYCDCARYATSPHVFNPVGDGAMTIPAGLGIDDCGTGQVPISMPYGTGNQYPVIHAQRPTYFTSGGNGAVMTSDNNTPHSQQAQGQQPSGIGSECDYDQAGYTPREDPPAPCPPMASGCYADSCPQTTLPLRPLRTRLSSDNDNLKLGSDKRNGSMSQGTNYDDGEDIGAIVPLTNASGPVFPSDDPAAALLGGVEKSGSNGHSMRRRPVNSSTANGNTNSNNGDNSRTIPSLHPNYFLASPMDDKS